MALSGRGFTPTKIVALGLMVLLTVGLLYIRFAPGEAALSVPAGAEAGDLVMEPCVYPTGDGDLAAECGTIVVPENRADPGSRLIALPVTRILAAAADPAEPVFYLQGGPGVPNDFEDPAVAGRFTDSRDVLLVGYRGVQGSSVLACPEMTRALRTSADLVGEHSLQRYGEAFTACARRLGEEGVDLDGYTLTERVEDMEAVRVALGYDRVDLLSESAGTRTAMIYAWRHPESVHRSVMLAVNPPGHYLWDPDVTDDQLRSYADLCAEDASCNRRTDDLTATMRTVADDMPDRWLFLPINEDNVRVGSFYGLMETTPAAGLLSGPMVLDSWLSAAEGDPSGLWLLSNGFIAFPDVAWGERAATGVIDAPYARDYYASGDEPGSILGDAATDFSWLGGRLADAWPSGRADEQYHRVQPSDVPTLLIGGTLDFSTPPRHATQELLPSLSDGQQVVLADFGHTISFWQEQPEAGTRLINHFYDTGEVDDSLYAYQAVDFTPQQTHGAFAKVVLATLIAFGTLALVLLLWMPRHVRRRGGFGPRVSAVCRALLVPVGLGLGGWCLATLAAMAVAPDLPVGNRWLTVIAVGLAIGAGTYWAWVRSDWPSAIKRAGFVGACAGGLAGGWLGSLSTSGLLGVLTAIVGAAIGANLVLVLRDVAGPRDGRHPTEEISEDAAREPVAT